MKMVKNLSGILKSDEINSIPAETVCKIEQYFQELDAITSDRNTEYLKFYDKLSELTDNDTAKTMELERMRHENVELRKQLEKVQAEVSVLKRSGFTFDEIEEFAEYKGLLKGIQSDLKINFKDFETKIMDIKTRMAKLCERFMVKFAEADFCDKDRGRTLSEIHDALHRISFRYNEWHNTSLMEIRRQLNETETQMTGAIYLIHDKLKTIEDVSAFEFDTAAKNEFNGFATNGVVSFTSMQPSANNNNHNNININNNNSQFGQVSPVRNAMPPIAMPSKGVTFVNGFNNLQPNFNANNSNNNPGNQSFAEFLNTIMPLNSAVECPSSIYRGSVPVNAATFGNYNSNTAKSPGVIKRPVSKNGPYGSNSNTASTSTSTSTSASTSSAFCSNDSDSTNRQQPEPFSFSSFKLFF